MKLYRLIGILLMLQNNTRIPAKVLAERFEISVRTVYRDIDILSQAGIPLVTESGAGGGISILEGYKFNISTLNQNEIVSMLGNLIGSDYNKDSQNQSMNMLLKIRQALPLDVQNDFDRLIHSVKIDSTSWFGKRSVIDENDKKLEIIKQSIISKKKIKFDYSSYQRITKDRIVSPYGLVKKALVWYLVGYCEERNELRVFNLLRIQQVNMLEEEYIVSKDFDLNKFWSSATENFEKSAYSYKSVKNKKDIKYPVTVKCTENQLFIFDGFNTISKEIEGENTIITVDFINAQIAMQQLIMYIDRLVICEPNSLKCELLKKVTKFLEINNS